MDRKNIAIGMMALMLLGMQAYALQDANLTMVSPNANLCLADSLDYSLNACNNQTLLIEGTQDHVIYMKTAVPVDISNSSAAIGYFMTQPVAYVSGFAVILLFFGAFTVSLILIYALIMLLARATGFRWKG